MNAGGASTASRPSALSPERRPSSGGGSPGARREKRRGPSRREFLRGGLLASSVGVIAAFGGASLAFVWPSLRGGFGAQLDAGSESFDADEIAANGHVAFPAGRAYLVPYEAAQDPDGVYAEATGGTQFMALYHKCVHLGCRVPWCASSSWFECPCH